MNGGFARLPERPFPEGAKAGWWTKTVQLDLEAKGVVARENQTPPLAQGMSLTVTLPMRDPSRPFGRPRFSIEE
jgi:Family of unknown function (DUF6958)